MPRTRSALLLITLLSLGVTSAVAGQLFPCPKAVTSDDRSFLVVSDVQFEHFPNNRVQVEKVSLQVFPKEHFINAKDRFHTSAIVWTDWARWSIVLSSMPMHNEPECPVPLVTNDGEFLVLLHIGGVFSAEDVVLQVYRWDHQWNPNELTGYRGLLVREIHLKEVWSPLEIANNTGTWTDESPEWFSGGTFEFSSDCRQLKHKTRWGYTAQVNLADGSVLWIP